MLQSVFLYLQYLLYNCKTSVNQDRRRMEDHDSSNSGAEQYFQKLGLRKVSFDGQISDSGQDSHSSESNYKGGNNNKVKRNNYSKQISSLLKQEENENGADDEKTKIIKKNCVSAKMSRQRKKIYIQLLQKKVQFLKQNIINTRERLKVNRSRIMHYIQQSNKQKRVYIEQKMKDSKRLIAMSEQFSSLSTATRNIQYEKKQSQMGNVVFIPQHHAHNYLTSIPQNLQPNQIPPQMQIPRAQDQMVCQAEQKQKSMLTNNKKSKRTVKNKQQPQGDGVFKQIQQKKQLLQLGINSYLYKFGINGILKNDVVQLLKEKWYELVIDESILDAGKSAQLEKVICDFRDCFWQIDQSNKKLDYLLRQLRDKIKPEYVVKFILEKEFFKSFSTTPHQYLQSVDSLASAEKMEHSEQVKQQNEEEQEYQPPANLQPARKLQAHQHSNNKMNEICQNYPYQNQNVQGRNKIYKNNGTYEQGVEKQYNNDLDFELDL